MYDVHEEGCGACVVVAAYVPPFLYLVSVPDAELRVRPEMHPFVPL